MTDRKMIPGIFFILVLVYWCRGVCDRVRYCDIIITFRIHFGSSMLKDPSLFSRCCDG